MLTGPQMYRREKTVTRRLGWWTLFPSKQIRAVEKSRGLKKGEHVKPIGIIEIVCLRGERLDRMIEDPQYGVQECVLEGFPHLTPQQFVKMFCDANDCKPDVVVNRIQFTHV
jgi:hypothetical protein